MAPVRLAIVGAGIAARELHLPALARIPHAFEVVGVYSRSAERARQLADRAGIPTVYPRLEDLLADDRVEAVDLCVPYYENAPLVEACAAAGKHVLVEKPVADSMEEARRVADAARRWGVTVMIGEQFRFREDVRAARRLLAEGRIGEVRMARHVRLGPVGPAYRGGWRFAEPRFVSYILDGGVHEADLLRSLLGEPAEVHAWPFKMDPGLPGPDTVVAVVRFGGQVVAEVTMSFASSVLQEETRTVIHGTGGQLQLSRGQVDLVTPGHADTYRFPGMDPFRDEFLHFFEVLRCGAELEMTPEEGMRDLRLALAWVRPGTTVFPSGR